MIGNFNDEYNFLDQLSLTHTQVLRLRKDFANNSPGNIEISKTQFNQTKQSGGFLGKI